MELKDRALMSVAMTPLSTAKIAERMTPRPSVEKLRAALCALADEGKVRRVYSGTKVSWIRTQPRAQHSVPVRTVDVEVAMPCYSTAISQKRSVTMRATPWSA